MSPASAMGGSYRGVPKIHDNVNDLAQNPASDEHVISVEHLHEDLALGRWALSPMPHSLPHETG